MAEPLEAPRRADDLYYGRSAEPHGFPRFRPIMTGDVFENVQIPGVERVPGDEQQLGMVVSHPCSMRQGAQINERVQVVRVVKRDPINLSAWPKMHFDLMPLPDLTVVLDLDDITSDDPEAEFEVRRSEGAHAACLDLRGRVESTFLPLQSRIACLTEQGVALLHQRMTHHDTRHAPTVELLVATCNAVFSEIELWEQWNDQLVDAAALDDQERLRVELDRVGALFDGELSKKRPIPEKKNGWYTLREDLNLTKRHASARREIHRLLEIYTKAASQSD